jgi:deoxycytidine triphosphate deaminase
MTILSDRDILQLVKSATLIEDFEQESLQGASYDMRVGKQYIKHGRLETLDGPNLTILLEPGEFALLRSHEVLNVPLDLVGHNGLMSPWAKRGLVSLFSPQIDPGFQGFLIVPVFNGGDSPISICDGERIFTIEFARLETPASYGWSARHHRQVRMTVPVTPSHIRANLLDVTRAQTQISEISEKFREMQVEQVKIIAELQLFKDRFGDIKDGKNLRLARIGGYAGLFSLIATIAIWLADKKTLQINLSNIYRHIKSFFY